MADHRSAHSPIKLLHVSDVHFGTETYGRLDAASGLNTRLLDFAACFDQAIDCAIAEGVDLAIFTGDAYRSRDPNPTHQREFARRIHRLVAADIPVFLLVGNHDLPLHLGRAHSMDIFETLAVPNVFVARKPGLQIIPTRRGPVQVAAMPWVIRSVLLAKDEFKNHTLDEINVVIAERIARIVQDQAEQLDPALPAVLCAHLSVMGAVYGSERSIMLGQDVAVPKSALAHPAFDYIALGHVHKHQVLHTRPLMLYPGSIERVDFGEEHDEKGFVLVTLAKGEAEYRFVPVKARRFLSIEIRAGGDDPLQQVLNTIARHDVAEAIVRVLIHTTAEQEGRIPYSEVRKALKGASYVAAISKKVQREERHRLGGQLAEAISPEDALQLYLRAKQVPPERQKTLLQYAGQLIRAAP